MSAITIDTGTLVALAGFAAGPTAAYVMLRVGLATLTARLDAISTQLGEARQDLAKLRDGREAHGEDIAEVRSSVGTMRGELGEVREEQAIGREERKAIGERLAKLEADARRSGRYAGPGTTGGE